MTADGRFTWDDLGRVVDGGFEGISGSDALGMISAAVHAPALDSGEDPQAGEADRDALSDIAIASYLASRAPADMQYAADVAARAQAGYEDTIASAMYAVTGTDPDTYARLRASRDMGDPSGLRALYADYLERS